MSIAAVVAAVVTCFSLMWSRGSAADDVIVSTMWLYERLSWVIVLEATYTLSDQQTNVEHIPGQYTVLSTRRSDVTTSHVNTIMTLLGHIACTQCTSWGVLLQMSHVTWSVCLSVVGHIDVFCQNGTTDRDAVWGLTHVSSRNHVFGYLMGSRSYKSIRSRERSHVSDVAYCQITLDTCIIYNNNNSNNNKRFSASIPCFCTTLWLSTRWIYSHPAFGFNSFCF